MTLIEQLADAKAQYHLLISGQQAKVFVDQNGERVEYASANRAELLKYITRLETQTAGTTTLSGPMRPFS